MTTTTPQTEAGAALLALVANQQVPDHATPALTLGEIRAAIAEARADAEAQVRDVARLATLRLAQIAALHAVATEAAFNWQNPNEEREHEAMAALGEVLSDNAQAAKDHDARVADVERERLMEKARYMRGRGMLSEAEFGLICGVVLIDFVKPTEADMEWAREKARALLASEGVVSEPDDGPQTPTGQGLLAAGLTYQSGRPLDRLRLRRIEAEAVAAYLASPEAEAALAAALIVVATNPANLDNLWVNDDKEIARAVLAALRGESGG